MKRPKEGNRKKAAGSKEPIAAYKTDYDSWDKFNPAAEDEDEECGEEGEEQEQRYRARMAETNATNAREKGNG